MDASLRTLPPNPKDEANIFSILIFWYTVKIFKKGFSKVLDVTDLFQPLKIDRSASLGDRLEKKWEQQLKNKQPSLTKAICFTFWRELGFLAILTTINELCIRMVHPILLGKLLEYFRLDAEAKADNTSIMFIGGGMVLLNLLSSVTFNHFTINAFHLGMKCRVAVCSLIYRKSLKLSKSALSHTAPGKVVNLLSNDVGRFDIVSIFLNSMWSAPLLSVIVGVLLWREIGWAGIVGISVVFIVVPIQSYTGKLSSKFRYQTAVRTDERVRFMDEIISGVQVIKMYAWEKPFSKLITWARRFELKIVRRNSHVRALYMTFNLFTTRAAMFCTMMTMALTNGEISATRIFVISSYFNIISWTMSQMFVRGVAEIAEALVAFKRLQAYLEYEEKEPSAQNNIKNAYLNSFNSNGDSKEKRDNRNKLEFAISMDTAIKIENASAKWKLYNSSPDPPESNNGKELEHYTLRNINLEIKKGQLIGIVGSVGAGKSSLLQVVLEELPLLTGSIVINGRVSYSTQEPWVFAASVRQNILFGQEMDKSRYDAVIKSCALIKDFEQLTDGDLTIIGEKGASLSGGQKARISLARAVYREADIYLLDDPLSAVDAHVGKHLFDEVMGPQSRLARRSQTRLLVTHQIHFLKEADWVIILNDGKIECQGPPSELSKTGVNFAELLESEELVDKKNESVQKLKRRTNSRSSTRSLGSSYHSLGSIGTDDSDDDENNEEYIKEAPQNLELSSKGTVKGSLIGNYFKYGANVCTIIVIFCLFLLTQFAVSSADFWVSYWTSQEELRTFYSNQNLSTINETMIKPDEDIFDTIDSLVNATEIHNQNVQNSILSTETCLYIHGGIIVSIFTIGILRAVGFYSVAMRASQNLHDGMFHGIISVAMRFYDINPSGRILNRFAKDMGSVDELLPKVMLDTSQIILVMFGAILVTAIVKPIFLIPVFVLGCLFMVIRKIYLKTSKNIKRLEGSTRSPVFTHLSATLSGLSTIRAFGTQKELIQEFDNHQDLHSGVWYMFLCTSTAFGLSLDIICLMYMGCVTFYFLLLDKNVMGSDVGLAITQSMALGGLLQWGIRQSAEVANQLMSVERIIEYCQLDPEKQPTNPVDLKKEWPSYGKVEFKNLFYRYFEAAEPVLKGINFIVQPNEKIGIVGRTGAGKSSLIGALFRLAKIEGDILIDDINTDSVCLNQLRSNLSIIPQDPVLFSGTLRRNLDPFEEYPDEKIWKALEAVELKELTSGNFGLQSSVMAGGSNFSVGQRQLICLARAILRNNKILVLDEATANVDPHTDNLIQTTIRHQFQSCTVLTIAHRLHTIMDSDRVLVMNFGIVEEYDSPYILLKNQEGIFRNMVDSTGPSEREKLFEMAKIKYLSKEKTS